MSEQILQHEAPDPRAGIKRAQDKQRLEHDREVIPQRHHGPAAERAEDMRHAHRQRGRAARAGVQRLLAHVGARAPASARRSPGTPRS